jgi:hypothetical protein
MIEKVVYKNVLKKAGWALLGTFWAYISFSK